VDKQMFLMYSMFKNNIKSALKEGNYRNVQQDFIINPV